MKTEHLILFDGSCNLCNSSVDFILRHDKNKIFTFSPLQSEFSQNLLAKMGNFPTGLKSIVLIEGDKAYFKSTAALRIARKLEGPIKLAYIFILVPRVLRDTFYMFISDRRYKWFGKRQTCRIADEKTSGQFL